MREILFRAKIEETEFQNIPSGWGQKDGDWVYGLYYIRTECTCHGYERCECDGFDQHLISDAGRGDYPIDVDTLGQYTGLKDKNGKMIYEGDIVKYIVEDREEESNGIISYAEEFSLYDLYTTNGYYYPLYKIIVTKVIGNIHDNKELLEE